MKFFLSVAGHTGTGRIVLKNDLFYLTGLHQILSLYLTLRERVPLIPRLGKLLDKKEVILKRKLPKKKLGGDQIKLEKYNLRMNQVNMFKQYNPSKPATPGLN